MEADRALTDADRETAVAALRAHAGDGVIDLDGFGDRTAAVLAAPTVGELAAVFADLPGGMPALPSTPVARPTPVRARRPRPAIPMAPIVPLAILFVGIWALTGFGYFWPAWPILGISIGALTRGRGWRSPHWV